LKIPRGGEFYLTLSDNTKVWLNSETTLKYPVEFAGEERRVELTGEAFFEVEKDAERPFRVVSDEQVVEVLGTSFNISSYPEDSVILTTLVEGKVNVFLGENPETSQTLLPKHQSFLARGEDRIMQREVDVSEYVAWKDGEFYFRDQSLENIMKTLSRWYDIDVVFNEPQAKDILFTGHLERYENFERILNLIQRTNEVSYSEEGRTITIDIIY
jgi:transmembrane sensor